MDTLQKRFDAKYIPEPNSGCWLWCANVDRSGYGKFRVNGVYKRAHRASYEMHNGPIEDGLLVLHRCDVPLCVNPQHLFLGTCLDNVRDREKKGRGAIQHGEANPGSKLNEKQAISIKHAPKAISSKTLSKKYGVSYQQIDRIRTGQQWCHLP